MTSPLDTLEPKGLWAHFDGIRRTPRPSKHEEKIIQHLKEWATDRGHEIHQDAAGTLSIHVAATPGHENAPTIVLQNHMDMVCEKNADVEHDFMTEGIKVAVDGDWVHAVGTTLGADNGVGLAAALAVADDPEAVHGPLEILCTVDEETGLTGAMELDPAIVSGRIMLNLDTEEDGAVYIGCAGGADSNAELAFKRRRALLGSVPVRLAIGGLRGGHSGLNIIENRGNAILFAIETILTAMEQDPDIDIVHFDAGTKHNAIPRESFVTLRILKDRIDGFKAVMAKCLKGFNEEFGSAEPSIELTLEALDDTPENQRVMETVDRDDFLRLVDSLPHGVLSMSRDVPGLVETSTNLAVVRTSEDSAHFVCSHRSSIMPALFAVRRRVGSIFDQAGATVTIKDSYPGWKPNPNSPIVQTTVKVFEKIFGTTPELKAIHAGLECGLLIEKVPDMDCVSIGPQIDGAHSPEEKVQISSVQRFYTHLKGVLAELA
jgi:dipeptidase D